MSHRKHANTDEKGLLEHFVNFVVQNDSLPIAVLPFELPAVSLLGVLLGYLLVCDPLIIGLEFLKVRSRPFL